MKDDDSSHIASEAETIAALRRFGWLRDDGDGERLHRTRPALATDANRCTGYYSPDKTMRCRLAAPHGGLHQPEPVPEDPNGKP